MFRTAGMPPEMSELVDETTNLIGEAIVALIEDNGCEIVSKERVIEMQIAEQDENATRIVAVHCRCDSERKDPLAMLTVTNSPTVLIDGKQLINGLAARSPEHPHQRVTATS